MVMCFSSLRTKAIAWRGGGQILYQLYEVYFHHQRIFKLPTCSAVSEKAIVISFILIGQPKLDTKIRILCFLSWDCFISLKILSELTAIACIL